MAKRKKRFWKTWTGDGWTIGHEWKRWAVYFGFNTRPFSVRFFDVYWDEAMKAITIFGFEVAYWPE